MSPFHLRLDILLHPALDGGGAAPAAAAVAADDIVCVAADSCVTVLSRHLRAGLSEEPAQIVGGSSCIGRDICRKRENETF